MAVGMALEMDVAKRLFFKKNKINKIKKKRKTRRWICMFEYSA